MHTAHILSRERKRGRGQCGSGDQGTVHTFGARLSLSIGGRMVVGPYTMVMQNVNDTTMSHSSRLPIYTSLIYATQSDIELYLEHCHIGCCAAGGSRGNGGLCRCWLSGW